MLAIASGCYASHGRGTAGDAPDASSSDAPTLDARTIDARVIDAALTDAWRMPPCGPTTHPTMPMPCTATVRFPALALSEPRCFVDTRVDEGEEGVLRWDCMGGGAELVFANGTRFGGSVVGDRLEVCATSSYDHSCHWDAVQRIAGTIGSGTLAYTYEETTPGGFCADATACGATGDVPIE